MHTEGGVIMHFVENQSIEFWAIIVSSIVALGVAAGIGKYLKPFIGLYPKLQIIDVKNLWQGRQENLKSDYWRIIIKNNGNDIAQMVQVDITELIIDGQSQEDFLPLPLKWTHLKNDEVVRDILPDQIVYLDIGVFPFGESYMQVQSPIMSETDGLEKIRENSILELTFYLKNGKSFKRKVAVDVDQKIIELVS